MLIGLSVIEDASFISGLEATSAMMDWVPEEVLDFFLAAIYVIYADLIEKEIEKKIFLIFYKQ